ncbi:DnaJ domain-containing protein [Sphaerosporella brunnea]|uniref:DnaJ domain-containing protein n=1 Tax=Sphaerosporella brunnea TaxID=1250544 RepID=A0A5J5F5A2_9PEZI|nr:DnaJ domain-containing protein [Sphaerosporella brunnea]
MQCNYCILKVERTAGAETIRTAYREMSLKNHPDKHPEEHREKQTAIFQKIVEAYDVLKDDQARAAYDRQHHDCFTCEVLRTPSKRNKGPSPNDGPSSPCSPQKNSSASTWPPRPATPYRKHREHPSSTGHQEDSDNWTDSDWIDDEYSEEPGDPEDGYEHYWN